MRGRDSRKDQKQTTGLREYTAGPVDEEDCCAMERVEG